MSADYRQLRNATTGEVILPRTKWCASYWCHLRGLQFRGNLPDDEGLLFVTRSESIPATTIHMFNVFFSIAVVWLDREGLVVDKTLAKPFRPIYAPSKPAMYYVEANPPLLDRVTVGDTLTFNKAMLS